MTASRVNQPLPGVLATEQRLLKHSCSSLSPIDLFCYCCFTSLLNSISISSSPFPLHSNALPALIVSMPTPSSNSPQFAPQLTPVDVISARPTCPPEPEANRDIWREHQDTDEETTPTSTSFAEAHLSPFRDHDSPVAEPSAAGSQQPAGAKDSAVIDDDDTTTTDSMSPAVSVSTEGKDELGVSPSARTPTSTIPPDSGPSSMNHEFSNVRVRKHSKSAVRK